MNICDADLYFEREEARLRIGDRTFIGNSILFCSQAIAIGSDVLISSGCRITDHDSHSTNYELRKNDVIDWYHGKKDWTHVPAAPVTIGDKAWIGMNVIITKGVTIGEGAVVGAGSVVTKDLPPYCLAAGNPAVVRKELQPPSQ